MFPLPLLHRRHLPFSVFIRPKRNALVCIYYGGSTTLFPLPWVEEMFFHLHFSWDLWLFLSEHSSYVTVAIPLTYFGKRAQHLSYHPSLSVTPWRAYYNSCQVESLSPRQQSTGCCPKLGLRHCPYLLSPPFPHSKPRKLSFSHIPLPGSRSTNCALTTVQETKLSSSPQTS